MAGFEHAKGNAGLHAEIADTAHHFDHGIKGRTIAHASPCGPHAETIRPGGLGTRRHFQNHTGVHQLFPAQLDLAVVG